MTLCDSLGPWRRASFPSLGATRRCACRFAPCGPGHPTAGLGFVIRSPLPEVIAWRPSGPPKFLENPPVPLPCSPTPAGPTRQAIRRSRHGPRYVHNEGSHDYILSGLNHTALALAVYASWSGSPQRCTQDSLPAVGHITGRDWLPAGFLRKVSDDSHPPSPNFLGARTLLIISHISAFRPPGMSHAQLGRSQVYAPHKAGD